MPCRPMNTAPESKRRRETRKRREAREAVRRLRKDLGAAEGVLGTAALHLHLVDHIASTARGQKIIIAKARQYICAIEHEQPCHPPVVEVSSGEMEELEGRHVPNFDAPSASFDASTDMRRTADGRYVPCRRGPDKALDWEKD